MAENGPREDLAKLVSSKILEKFKWEQHGPSDHDFPCEHQDEHKPLEKKQAHTHPVDVVFHYKDPYLNKTIYLNTDLKSYAKGNLNSRMIESALDSLGKTIQCAQINSVWKERYETCVGQSEVRGLLFVYNHTNDYDNNFYDLFNPPKPPKGRRPSGVNLDKVFVAEDQQIHIIEPKNITYLMSVISDMNELIAEQKFPRKEYGFFYPQLTYHKVLTSEEYLPATVETLTAPFMIIKHGPVQEHDRDTDKYEEIFPEGFVIYYNEPGKTDLEFYYLLDTLSNYQILNSTNKIRIRVASLDKTDSIRSNFTRAVEKYSYDWGYDETMKKNILSIELFIVPIQKEHYLTEDRSWRFAQ